jgi:hypothetical protein
MQQRVHDVLTRCGVNACTLLTSLGPTRAIISGSVPVVALTGLTFKPNDVDIYVPPSSELDMERVILEMDFTCDIESGTRYPEVLGIRTIKWFSKGKFKINLLVAMTENPLVALFRFHSTVVMNFISYLGLYCAYPDLTLHKMSIANPKYIMDMRTLPRTLGCINRYRERGITFETNVSSQYHHIPI